MGSVSKNERREKAKIRSHLHFSLGLASPDLAYEIFHWDLIRDPANITLLDPLKMIRAPYYQPRYQISEKRINNARQGLKF